MVLEKMNSEEIDESEWTSIVSYLYHSKDATTLRLLLRQEANRIREERGESSLPLSSVPNRVTSAPSPSRSYTPNKRRPSSGTNTPHKQKSTSQPPHESATPTFTLPFSVFLNCVLDFQISNHIKYLEGFHNIFTSCDTDRDGLLSLDDLVECFHRLRNNDPNDGDTMGTEERELFDMVKKLLDPLNTGRIAYTVMASCMNQIGKKIMNSSTVTPSTSATQQQTSSKKNGTLPSRK